MLLGLGLGPVAGGAGRVRRRRARLPWASRRRCCSPPRARRPRPGSSSRPTPSWSPRIHCTSRRSGARRRPCGSSCATIRATLRTSGRPGPGRGAGGRARRAGERPPPVRGAGRPAAGCCCSRPPRAGSGLLPGQSVTAEGLLAPPSAATSPSRCCGCGAHRATSARRRGGSRAAGGLRSGLRAATGTLAARRGRAAARPGHRRHEHAHPGGRRRLPRRRAHPSPRGVRGQSRRS